MTSIRLIVFSACALAVIAWAAAAPAARRRTAPRVPVVAELFTSEGCSSCPPADALLRRLIAEQPIDGVEVIALSEHVDYWNHLGWKDPFSSAAFSERQARYARAFGTEDIYTPQLVIDGRLQAIGSDWPAVRTALGDSARAARATVTVAVGAGTDSRHPTIRASAAGLPPAFAAPDLRAVVAVVEDGLHVDVARGENARRQLQHDAVTRSLQTVDPHWTIGAPLELASTVALDPGWIAERLRAIVFLQDVRTSHIAGAGTARLAR